MHAVRRRLRACAWLALLSISALAVGPTVSRMLLPAGASHLSAQGAHARHRHLAMMPAAAAQTPAVPAHEHALEHCGLCLLAAHAFTFVAEPPAPVAAVECIRPALVATPPAAPRLRCDWSPASSRGPPLG